jgi:hypothetical protein
MKLKHTPGPWETLKTNGISIVHRSHFDLRYGLAKVEGKNEVADAQLIAAAPEMLNMLLYIAEEMHRGGLTPKGNDAFEKICNIIEKATGRKIEDIKKD